MDIVSFAIGMSAAGDKTELLENVEIPVDFSNGNQTVEAEEGKAIKSAVIQKPAELVAENIKENTTIAGIAGTLPVYELTEKNVELDFSAGDAVVMAESRKPFSKVTINKPETLVAENIAKNVNIAGIIGTLESGGGDDIGAEKYLEEQVAEVVLPNAESIKPYAFYYDTVLTNIVMPKVKSIGDYAFYGCTNLALTSLPSGVTSIEKYSFRDCTNLALTSLPNGLTSMGEQAFSGCTNLALTSLPSGITKLETSVFQNCTNLALTSLPSGIILNSNALRGCTNLTFKTLPSRIYTMSASFYGCTGLTSITFEGKPDSLHSNTFPGCTNLTTINVPWAEGEVKNAPWGATNATINYNYTGG